MTTSWDATFRPRRLITGAVIAVVAAALCYGAIPRRADLRAFDPDRMARLETAMWRHYYERRYVALFLDLYQVARREQGFSPLDSVRIAMAAARADEPGSGRVSGARTSKELPRWPLASLASAARAAKSFQPSTSRAEAEAAIPHLEGYFRILARAAPVVVSVEDLARTELAWWQARREAVPPDQYGAIIARIGTLLYGVDNADIRRSGVVRAQAMEYRDARGAAMTEPDWAAIDRQLRVAYGLLKKAVSSAVRSD